MVYIRNPGLRKQFEEERERLFLEHKVDECCAVRESLLFHGSERDIINTIVEENFTVEHQANCGREKTMLFGRGVYMSPLPGVSMMYGHTLLLCKDLLGKFQIYHPTGLLYKS